MLGHTLVCKTGPIWVARFDSSTCDGYECVKILRMHKCSKCGLEKDLSEFHKRPNGRPYSHCKLCQNAYGREHYKNNTNYYVEKAAALNAKLLAANRQWVLDYLQSHPCIDCGETDPIVLEFDHRDPTEKTNNVSSLMTRKPEMLQAEVVKCDVRCANCHRRKTAIQFGWWVLDQPRVYPLATNQ